MMKNKSCETTEYRLKNSLEGEKALNEGDLNDTISTDKVLNILKHFHTESQYIWESEEVEPILVIRGEEDEYGKQ